MEQSLAQFADAFRKLYHVSKPDVRQYSALTLAYIGDAVYELVIRSYIVDQGNAPVEKLHKRASQIVKAATQAKLIMAIESTLSEEEHDIYKRGRNAKSFTKAKNASTIDYRKATGCEALIGYLFLCGRYERIIELIHDGLVAINIIKEEKSGE